MEVKIKKLNNLAQIPAYAHNTDAGLDLIATSLKVNRGKGYYEYGTGLAIEIPDGYVGLLYPRSSVRDRDGVMTNHVGVIDSGYRGEILACFKNYDGMKEPPYEVGEKIGQLIIIPYPKIKFVEVDELTDSDRGEKGHGSTDK